MRRAGYWIPVCFFVVFFLGRFNFTASAQSRPAWNDARQFPSDLEIGGALAGLPPESIRYITRQELLAMPQVSFTATGDSNFTAPAQIGGVDLEELAKRFGVDAQSETIVAICDDKYLAPYPSSYVAAHHPVLVLTINGQPPEGWPKAADDHTSDMGPYLISNPKFAPSFKVLSHEDEAQIPWGVVRIEFRDEKKVLEAIAPRGPHASLRQVQDGFQIAQQNCFRCHNAGPEGGKKSGIPWERLAALAAGSPDHFAAYVRAPSGQNSSAQMPGNPQYDDATLRALSMYFQTFASPAKP
jgi:mono/diheme cytochrome c family protein